MANSKIKDLTPKAVGDADDEFAINDVTNSNADKKMGMDGLRITSSQVTDLDTSTVTFANKTIDGDDNTIVDINETQMNVSVGASGTLLTSNGVGSPPTFQVAAGGGLTFAKVVKPTDETVNNSTTFQDDDSLTFAVSANKSYHVLVLLFFNGTTVASIKTRISIPISATAVRNNGWGTQGNGTADWTVGQPITLFGADRANQVHGKVIVGGTAGNVTFQWAQNTAEVSDTKVLKGSVLLVWEE